MAGQARAADKLSYPRIPQSLASSESATIIEAMQRTIGYFWRFYFTLASEGPLAVHR